MKRVGYVIIIESFFFFCREFGMPCVRCNVTIRSDDWIRKARDNCYHLACFSCDVCNRQLSTGEQFALHNNRLLCKIHYLQVLQGDRLGDGKTLTTNEISIGQRRHRKIP